MRGKLITLEGIDGAGKTTLIHWLADRLESIGIFPIVTREPWETPWGRRLRRSFAGPERLSPEEEARLFLEDRAAHARSLIAPALQRGLHVLCDRYYHSTMAYQGARGLDPERIRKENERVAPRPDLVLLLVLPPGTALRRIAEGRGEEPNRFEQGSYLQKVGEIYEGLGDPEIKRLDAERPFEELADAAWKELAQVLSLGRHR